jgi:hypothetical protein
MIEDRRASVIVSDDFFYSIAGKVSLSGVYIQDLVVPFDGSPIGQLVFFFTIETPKERPFKTVSIKIQFPGQEPKFTPIPIFPRVFQTDPRRTKIVIKQPILIQQISLSPGKIQATVIHEEGEIDAGVIWIVLATDAPPTNTQPEI